MGHLRTQRRVVVLLFVLAVLRGGFWTVASITPSPIDEMQHFDYVRSVARAEGVPIVGVDGIDDEVLRFAKQSPTFQFRSYPYPSDLDDPAWAGADPQYEGIQGPTYYALMAPFYWLGRAGGTIGSFYAVRLGSVLLGALAIPAAWLLARRLVPRRPEAWLLPPILLTFVNAVTSGAATIGNDVIVLSGSAMAAVAILWALERRRPTAALAAGLLAGLVFLGKTTALPMIPLFLLLGWPALRRWWAEGPGARRALRTWVVAYGAAFTAPFALWTAWNLHAYGSLTGAEAADRLTGALQEELPRTFEALRPDFGSLRTVLWNSQLADVVPAYHHVWEVAAAVLALGGLLVALRRRSGEDRRAIGWGTLAYPISVLAIIGLFFGLFGDVGVLLGRYTWVALVPLTIAMGVGAAVLAGRRGGAVLVLTVAAVACWFERAEAHDFLSTYYEYDLAGGDLAPIVDQSYSDGMAYVRAAVIDVGCPVHVVDLGFQRPPETLRISTPDGSLVGRLEANRAPAASRYRLPTPAVGRITVPLRDQPIAISLGDREPSVSLVGQEGDPVARAHCPADHPRRIRFAQLYDESHPPVSRWALRRWPDAMALAVTWAAAVGWYWWAELAWEDRRRRRVSAAR